MLAYAVRRLLGLVPVLLGITLLVFVIFRFVADPTQVILGMHGTAEQRAALRQLLGLDDPPHVQYLRFLGGLLRGDLGTSWYLRRPVAAEILYRLPHTIELTVAAMAITSTLGILAGVVAAVRHRSAWDYASMGAALLAVSMPVFWLGLVLIGYLAVRWRWFPVAGRMDPVLQSQVAPPTGFYIAWALLTRQWDVLADLLHHLVLPAVVLAAATTALVARVTRSSLLEVLGLDYVRTARAKGLPERVVIYRHALRNALIPVITVLGLQFGQLLGGAVLTESVFSWPGIGSLALLAIGNHDLPLIQGVVLVTATAFVLVNLVVDLAYALVDPRIRYD